MRIVRLISLLVFAALVGAGCSITPKQGLCSSLGAAAGAAIAIAATDDDSDNVGEEVGIATGALGGAVLGYALCADNDEDKDGVPDNLDRCPGTPAGVEVDATGCPLDSDRDGVPDYLDKCPDTPLGTKVDRNGCPLDSDGDGVTDDADQCPGTPPGVAVDSTGCPLDSDGDGVADYKDKCPGTPRGVEVDADGCPLAEEVVLVITGVNFATASAELDATAQALLDRAVPVLEDNRAIRFRVEGHTDSVGGKDYNRDLSQRRAASVIEYLSTKGVNPSRLDPVGYGESRPIASNDTPEGRRLNRRVEFTSLGQ